MLQQPVFRRTAKSKHGGEYRCIETNLYKNRLKLEYVYFSDF